MYMWRVFLVRPGLVVFDSPARVRLKAPFSAAELQNSGQERNFLVRLGWRRLVLSRGALGARLQEGVYMRGLDGFRSHGTKSGIEPFALLLVFLEWGVC